MFIWFGVSRVESLRFRPQGLGLGCNFVQEPEEMIGVLLDITQGSIHGGFPK